MGLKSILKESATWKKNTGKNEYGKTTFEVSTIKCMIEDKVKVVITSTGERLVNYSKILTIEPVEIGDEINDRPVISVNKIKNGRGKVQGVEVYLQ